MDVKKPAQSEEVAAMELHRQRQRSVAKQTPTLFEMGRQEKKQPKYGVGEALTRGEWRRMEAWLIRNRARIEAMQSPTNVDTAMGDEGHLLWRGKWLAVAKSVGIRIPGAST
jgi:hypothetical protein